VLGYYFWAPRGGRGGVVLSSWLNRDWARSTERSLNVVVAQFLSQRILTCLSVIVTE
jgi:hypothetical protein